MFVYKDFVLREILAVMNEVLSTKVCQILSQVEKDYFRFMETELVEWVSLMLQVGAFQSYSSIVSPNEATKAQEGMNYLQLQKRYMKAFMRVHAHTSSQGGSRQVISVIDSDFDEDDEYQQCEIDEIFSISPAPEELWNRDEFESDQDQDDHRFTQQKLRDPLDEDEDDEEGTVYKAFFKGDSE